MTDSFVIVYYGNTGSSWLIDTLGSLPEVLVPAFEPLEAWVWKAPDEEKAAWIRAAFSAPADREGPAFEAWVDALRTSPQFDRLIKTSFTTVAFKTTPTAFRSREMLVDVFDECGTRLVFLRRENRIKHALSLYRYHEEQKSQFDHSGVRPPSVVSLRRFDRWVRESQALDTGHRAFQSACEARLGSAKVTEVAYEEFIDPEGKRRTVERLVEFLGLHVAQFPRSRFEKATSDDLRAAVVNYDRLRRKYRRGPMAVYFEE